MLRLFPVVALLAAFPAQAEFYSAPTTVQIVDQKEVEQCEFLGFAFEADSFTSKNMDSAASKALDEAMQTASKAGANKVVFGGISAANKELVVTLRTYRC